MKVIGALIADSIFIKRVNKKKHFFRKLQAYGIDSNLFQTKLLPENRIIAIMEEETGIVFTANADTWARYGKYLHFKPHGAQIFLPIAHCTNSLDNPVIWNKFAQAYTLAERQNSLVYY